jgi:hypothetical protein
LQLIAGTSERGITVGLDVLDQHGASLHHQTIHFNRTTSTMIFTVPALSNLTSNATLQVRGCFFNGICKHPSARQLIIDGF